MGHGTLTKMPKIKRQYANVDEAPRAQTGATILENSCQ